MWLSLQGKHFLYLYIFSNTWHLRVMGPCLCLIIRIIKRSIPFPKLSLQQDKLLFTVFSYDTPFGGTSRFVSFLDIALCITRNGKRRSYSWCRVSIKIHFWCRSSYTIRRCGKTSRHHPFLHPTIYFFHGTVPPTEICLVIAVYSRTCRLGEARLCVRFCTPLFRIFQEQKCRNFQGVVFQSNNFVLLFFYNSPLEETHLRTGFSTPP
jgi:hypothetical protein